MIIDIHGHYTTAPKALEAWRNRQIEGIKDSAVKPHASELRISDDELRESIEGNQLRLMRERGLDLTIFSPRASFMAWPVLMQHECRQSSQPGRRCPASISVFDS